MLTFPPSPYVVGESSDVPADQCWVVRPQLFFSCHLRPRGTRLPRRANCKYGPDDIQVQIVLYSTFEPMVLPGGGPMEGMGVQKLYEPSPRRILYVGLAADVLGREPLMPLFLLGNSTPTIPHTGQLGQHRSARFPRGLADAADESGRKGSNVTVYEIDHWLWQFGRGKPRLGARWLRLRSGASQWQWMVRRGPWRHKIFVESRQGYAILNYLILGYPCHIYGI